MLGLQEEKSSRRKGIGQALRRGFHAWNQEGLGSRAAGREGWCGTTS
jgi:hypothetical protein